MVVLNALVLSVEALNAERGDREEAKGAAVRRDEGDVLLVLLVKEAVLMEREEVGAAAGVLRRRARVETFPRRWIPWTERMLSKRKGGKGEERSLVCNG